jgi:hypothetical protein
VVVGLAAGMAVTVGFAGQQGFSEVTASNAAVVDEEAKPSLVLADAWKYWARYWRQVDDLVLAEDSAGVESALSP